MQAARCAQNLRRLGVLLGVLFVWSCEKEREVADSAPPEPQPAPKHEEDAAVFAAAVPVANPTRSGPGETKLQCREQSAQDFLLRKGQIAKIGASKTEREQIDAARKRSIDYRTQKYGRFPGFGSAADNAHPPRFYAKRTKLMGVPVVVHEKIIPALECVEAALKRECTAQPYQPRGVSGIRFENSFKDYEVSNHVYGIAIDIDSQLNPCCNCVGKWREQEICKKKVSSVFERMAMPRCWVEVFERHGFYWLGHDELEDTMHFEFLGDPDQILSRD